MAEQGEKSPTPSLDVMEDVSFGCFFKGRGRTVVFHPTPSIINTAFKIVNDKKRYNNFHFVIDPRYPDLIRQSLVRIRNTFSPSGNTRMSGLYVAEGITLLRGLELMVTLATPGLFIVGGAISTDATIKYMSAQSPEENAVFIEAMSGKM